MALEITSVMTEIEFIHLLLPPLNLRRNLEQNLLDHDSKCKDCECHSAYVKHRSGSVFDKSSDGNSDVRRIISRSEETNK